MKRAGFTLIELLVVIAIIGLLSSVVFASLDGARNRARDARKEADLNSLMKAIALYHDDHNDLPINRTPTCSCWCQVGTTQHNGGYCLQELVDGGYVSELPVSPDNHRYYYYDYGSFAMVAVRMNPRRWFGNGTKGWHCGPQSMGGTTDYIYCLNYDI